jgi:membrane protease subunit (stomatin/prohibitin family)
MCRDDATRANVHPGVLDFGRHAVNMQLNYRQQAVNDEVAPAAGDWECPDCSFMNFASRSVCKNCGTPTTR